jgi:hypothetical protein
MFAKAGRGFGARAVGFYSKGCDAFYLGYQVEWLVQHVGFYLCGVAGEAELVAQPGAIVVGLDPTVVSPGAIWDQSIGNRAVISISKRP